MQPEELKNIRKMRGLTLDEVCQKLGRLVSKQALSKYERGKMHPSPQVLEALLRIYQISSASLQLSFPVKINGWNFRRGEILSAKEEEAIKSEINRCLQRYLYLENQLGIIASFKHPFSQKHYSSIDDMELAAEILRKKWELGTDAIPSVCRVMENAGIKVLELELNNRVDGLSGWVNRKIPFVVLNKRNVTVERKRFTALHELVHLLFPFLESLDVRTKEKYCHRFASALLFPAGIAYESFGKKRSVLSLEELVELKTSYGISVAALVHRANDLRIITEVYYNHIFDEYVKKNRLEDGWGGYPLRDKAERYHRMLRRALAESLVTEENLQTLCGDNTYEIIKEIHIL